MVRMSGKVAWMIMLFHCCMLSLWADDEVEAIKERINAIKIDPEFLGAESTKADEAEAYHEAVCQVQYYFNQWLGEQGRDTLSYNEIHSRVRSLSHPRGEKFRVFAYVNIKDTEQLLGAREQNDTAHVEVIVPRLSEAESIVAVQNVEVPSEIEIQPQETLKTSAETTAASKLTMAQQTTSGLVDVVISLQHIEMIEDARLVLQQFQREGKILEFQRVTSSSDIKDGRFLLMYEKNGTIRALLEVQQSELRNIKTNQLETSQQYKGCSAYWFR